MDELVRRALLGDKQAQEECTEKGILLPCPLCKGKVEYYFVKSYEEGWKGSIVVVPDKSYVVCKCGYGVCEIGEKAAIKIHNNRPAPPIGRCLDCGNSCSGHDGSYLVCCVHGHAVGNNDWCNDFEEKGEE